VTSCSVVVGYQRFGP